jgi:hypothetical protein
MKGYECMELNTCVHCILSTGSTEYIKWANHAVPHPIHGICILCECDKGGGDKG